MNAEITIRLEGNVLTALDALAQNTGLPSRRDAIEKILQRWYEQRELHRETKDYYQSLTPDEIAEDRAWVQLASEQALRRWDDQ